MQTQVTEAGPYERLLTVHIDEAELEEAKGKAARKLSREMKIKGFRPGKAPRQVVERMVGAAALRSEAIDEALPDVVGNAIDEVQLEPVTTPRVENIRDVEGGVEVDVKITLWPKVDRIPDIASRKITVDAPQVESAEIDEQIDRLRSQFAELEEVSREADTGDFVMVNITAIANGAEIEDASASDLLYEIGSRSFIAGLDELLVGASPGVIREGPATLPDGFGEHGGEDVTLRILVKGVRAKKLPEVTDEWVSDVSEFDSIDELTEQLRNNMLHSKVHEAETQFESRLLEALIEDMDIELPEALVDAEMEASLRNLVSSLQQQGIDLGNYLRITGQSEQDLVAQMRLRADRSLKTRVLLEGVAAIEGLEVEEEELTEAIASLAESSKSDVDTVRELLANTGQEQLLTGDILRRKALDRILSEATAIDTDGNPIDLSHDRFDEHDDESADEEPSFEEE